MRDSYQSRVNIRDKQTKDCKSDIMLFAYVWRCVCIYVCVVMSVCVRWERAKENRWQRLVYASSIDYCLSATGASLYFMLCSHPKVNLEACLLRLFKIRDRYAILLLLVLQCVFNKWKQEFHLIFIKFTPKASEEREDRKEKPRKPENGQQQPQHCLCYLPKSVAHPLGSPIECMLDAAVEQPSDSQPDKLVTWLLLLLISWTSAIGF